MAERLVTVFGGTGYLGRQITQRLAAAGWRVRVAARHAQRGGMDPGVEPCAVDIRDEQAVARALTGARAVVNAVGLYSEKGGSTFDAIHVEGALHVARQARAARVERVVHVSGIGVSRASPSRYVRARARGEQQVRTAFEQAVILRPSVLFGRGDSFLRSLDSITRLLPVVPLFGAGNTRLQPVYVGDVAAAVLRALEAASVPVNVYELGGSRVYTYRRIVELVLAHRGRRRLLLPVPFLLWELQAQALSLLPRPPLTADQVALMRAHNVVGPGVGTFADLGIAPRSLQDLLGECLPTSPSVG